MPGWGDLLNEIRAEQENLPQEERGPALDAKRVGYLRALTERTGRPVILYATAWLSSNAPAELTSIRLRTYTA